MIFMTYLIETCVVNAHPKLPVGLRDYHRIGQPPGVVDLPYEASVEQLLISSRMKFCRSMDCFPSLYWTGLTSG
jgi:hypothetical protein